MRLAEAIVADNQDRRIFECTDDFAEMRNINGVDVICAVDSDRTQDVSDNKAQGIYQAEFALFFRDGVLPGRPVVNGRVMVDGKPYTVMSLVDSNGLLEMRVKANKS